MFGGLGWKSFFSVGYIFRISSFLCGSSDSLHTGDFFFIGIKILYFRVRKKKRRGRMYLCNFSDPTSQIYHPHYNTTQYDSNQNRFDDCPCQRRNCCFSDFTWKSLGSDGFNNFPRFLGYPSMGMGVMFPYVERRYGVTFDHIWMGYNLCCQSSSSIWEFGFQNGPLESSYSKQFGVTTDNSGHSKVFEIT